MFIFGDIATDREINEAKITFAIAEFFLIEVVIRVFYMSYLGKHTNFVCFSIEPLINLIRLYSVEFLLSV